MDKIEILSLITRCVQSCREEIESGIKDISLIDYRESMMRINTAEAYLNRLQAGLEADTSDNWYVEIWNDNDIMAAIKSLGYYPSDEKIKMIKERCPGLFSKSSRMEILNDLVRQLFVIHKTQQEKEERQSLVEVVTYDHKLSVAACEILCKSPIRVYKDIDNPDIYYGTFFDFQKPEKVGSLIDLENWLTNSVNDDGEVLTTEEIIEIGIDELDVFVRPDKYGNFYKFSEESL